MCLLAACDGMITTRCNERAPSVMQTLKSVIVTAAASEYGRISYELGIFSE